MSLQILALAGYKKIASVLIKAMLRKEDTIEVYKEFFTEMIPVIISIVVFSLISWTSIASFGMVMFWGLLLTVPYHLAVTHTLIEEEKNKYKESYNKFVGSTSTSM